MSCCQHSPLLRLQLRLRISYSLCVRLRRGRGGARQRQQRPLPHAVRNGQMTLDDMLWCVVIHVNVCHYIAHYLLLLALMYLRNTSLTACSQHRCWLVHGVGPSIDISSLWRRRPPLPPPALPIPASKTRRNTREMLGWDIAKDLRL